MADRRQKNQNWHLPTPVNWEHVPIALLMDIRDELQGIRSLLSCHRVPRALDALYEVGQDIRRKKRLAAVKRKNAKARAK
jgi:hypothetical protein